MRTPWLLASISLHIAAVMVVLVIGVHAEPLLQRPVARVEIRNTPPSAPARAELQPAPDVQVEAEPDLQPLVDVRVPPAARPAPDPAPVLDERPLPPSPASVLNQVTTERIRAPQPVVEQTVHPPAAVPVSSARAQPPETPSEPAFTAATRLNLGRDKPAYPDKERRLGREGTVVLSVSVRADGTVADASLKTPSRYAGFNRAALRAVRTWRFAPATADGVAVESVIDVPVEFQLTEAAGR